MIHCVCFGYGSAVRPPRQCPMFSNGVGPKTPSLPLHPSNSSSLHSPLQICTFSFNNFQDAPPATPFSSCVCIVARGWVGSLPVSIFTFLFSFSAKSFRMRTCKQTPRFARFWPRLSSRNSFRIRSCKNAVCKSFRMRSYKKRGRGALPPKPKLHFPRPGPTMPPVAKMLGQTIFQSSDFRFRFSRHEVPLCLKP